MWDTVITVTTSEHTARPMIIMAFAQPEALAQGFALLASLVTLMSAYSTWVTCVYLQLSHLLHYVVVKYSWRMPHGLGGRVEIGFACCFLFSDVDVSPSLLEIRGVMDGGRALLSIPLRASRSIH